METTIVFWGHIGDSGKENGSYYLCMQLVGEATS